MDFQPNDEQRMLCESARRFFSQEFPLARVREIESQSLQAFLPLYRKMGELGYLGIAIAEEHGGGGGDWLDLALFAEEAGRALVPTLQISSLALGAQALLRLGKPEREQIADLVAGTAIIAPAWLETDQADRGPRQATKATASGKTLRIDGNKRFVQGYEVASELLVALCDSEGRTRFALVPTRASGIAAAAQRLSSLDTVHDLEFKAVTIAPERLLPGDWSAWLEIIDGAKIIAAAWAIGAARAALDMAVQYAKDRKQFGRPIGGFQAVQHRLADAAIVLEQASAMVRYAAWLRTTGAPSAREAAMAKLLAGRTVRQVTHAATLTHGGYGFMEEFDIQLYFRRAKQLDQLVEGPAMQRELIAAEPSEDLLRIH